MIRTILGAIVGYIVMAIFLFATFTGLYFVLGPSNSFLPDSFDVSNAWLVGSFLVGFIGTVIGGYVAVLIAKQRKAALWFGGLVLVLSLLVAVLAMSKGNPHEVRTGATPNMEAMQKAQQPVWFNFLIPFTGFVGAILGGRLKKIA
jgi:hypothetical protein